MTDTRAPDAEAVARGPKRLRMALLASLALNFLIIGAVVGHLVLAPHHARTRGLRGPHMILSAFAQTLPAERREALRSVLDAERQNLIDLRRELRRVRREASATLVAEPFDAEMLKAAMARVGETDTRLKSAGLALFVDVASKMSAEERRAFKEWRDKGRARAGRDDDSDDDKGQPPAK